MTVLIVGGDSKIGSALASKLRHRGNKLLETTRRKNFRNQNRLFLDLSDDVSTWSFPRDIDTAIICGGITSKVICEDNPVQTWPINVKNTCVLSKKFIDCGVRVVFLSTNLVFDGVVPFVTAGHARLPSCEYGKQKVKVENLLLEDDKSSLIVRLTKVLSPTNNLLREWVEKLSSGESIFPYKNAVMAPIAMDDVTEVLYEVCQRKDIFGVLQVSGSDDITYLDAAKYIGRRMNVNRTIIHSCFAEGRKDNVNWWPKYTTLQPTWHIKKFGIQIRDVWTVLDTILV